MQIIKEEGSRPIKAWVGKKITYGDEDVDFYAPDIEDTALSQLKNLARLPFIHSNGVAVMPDVHAGIGSTVGTVIATDKAIIPAAVGVDIGCVDMHTEYLSPTGWKRVVDYDGGMVMQFDPTTGDGTLVQPSAYIVKDCTEFLSLKSKYGINQRLTPDHKMLVYKIFGRERKRVGIDMLASEFERQHTGLSQGLKGEIETTFSLSSSNSLLLSDEAIRVQVMTHADCTLDNGKAVLRVKKQRKADRAKTLLDAAGLEYTESLWEDCITIRFNPPVLSKVYGEYWWGASSAQLKLIANEALNWDGNHDDKCFYTRSKMCADYMHYAFTAAGYRSVLRSDKGSDDALDYRVYQFTNTRVGLAGVPKTPITREPSEDGKAYCFTVPTGYWVMRRGGNIAMTGNCGMNAVRLTLKAHQLPDNLAGIRDAIEQAVPLGKGGSTLKVRLEHGDLPVQIVDAIFGGNEYKANQKAAGQLGTLGSGNHFIELCVDENQDVWVMLHSGSRGIGNMIGTHFISRAKKNMEKFFISLPDADLAYFPEDTDDFDDYVQAVNWAQDYALENRKVMMQAVIGAIISEVGCWAGGRATSEEAVSSHHNYVQRENHFGRNLWVTRKGAVSAREGQLGIIPGSMGQKSYIVRGKGNVESYCSCSHGAGRQMSRTEAKRRFSLTDLIAQTEGVECRKDEAVIDEIPGAYKNLDLVMENQKDLVEVVHTLKAVLCVKGN